MTTSPNGTGTRPSATEILDGTGASEALAKLPERVEPNGEGYSHEELLAELRNGAWLDRQHFPPLRYHVPGIIPEGATLLVGPPKVGKSWLVLSVALAVAAGGHALGNLPVERQPVLLLALEDGDRRLQDRCRTLLGHAPIPETLDYLTSVQPASVLPTIAAWLERQHADAAPLVILDTLGKAMPPGVVGESVYQRDYRVGGALKRLTDERPGAGLIINHHDRKAESDDFVEKVSGTNGLAGSADTIVVLARQRHELDGVVSVTGRDIPEAQYALHFDSDRGLWTLRGGNLPAAAHIAAEHRASAGLDARSQAIVAYVADHPEGVRAADVAKAVDIDEAQARQYLGRLYDTKRIAKGGRGLYVPVASVASVAFAEDPQLSDPTVEPTNATPPVASVAFAADRAPEDTER